MSTVVFHFNVPAWSQYLCRLLRKADAAGHRAWVLAPASMLSELDALLWTFAPQDFISHAVAAPGADAMLRRSAVALSDRMPADPSAWSLLVNMRPELPAGHESFERVIELVPEDEALKAAARQRWRHYRSLGHTLEQHDASKAGTQARASAAADSL